MKPGKEFALIDKIRRTIGRPSRNVLIGIGDDAAVLRSPNGKLVITVDSLVEGIHFDLKYTTPIELGHKALAINLSDIAAMGAQPSFAVVSLGLGKADERLVTEIYRGMRSLARKFSVDIVGGNLSRSPHLFVDMAVIGEVRRALTRSGARPGDIIAVTGTIGNSAAGLYTLKRWGKVNHYWRFAKAHLLPEPRVKEGIQFSKSQGVTSLIDSSDGVASELRHIAQASGVGVLIDVEKLPISSELRRLAKKLGKEATDWALYGGEDYELLATIRKSQFSMIRRKFSYYGWKLTAIGEVIKRSGGMKLRSRGVSISLPPKGWDHFSDC